MYGITNSWIYDITIALYALSVLGYFIDFLQNNRKANVIAFWLLSIVWVLQTISLLLTLLEFNRFPFFTIFEGLFLYVWLIVTLSLVINWFFTVDFFVFFANVFGFIIMSIHLFAPKDNVSTAVTEQLMSELLIIHISMAMLSYGAFALAFIFSIMYLFQHNLLKKKKWGKRLVRLGNLSQLESLSYSSTIIAVPMLALSLVLGIIWAYIKVEAFHWYDAKVLLSFIVLIVYSIYLFLKVGKGLHGKALSMWNIAGFLVILINLFLSGELSSFHLWE
ncbi:cytochrome C assembly protein [Lottiidibacillus patelloidae]|uniref:Cytochrome C assembly protein n=1 Tax=Lottiidibacillus patelloidae TaxID=2670334 RepID=A0A263BVV9_9BACI|nr:cytochrome c biogenesis protein [Lottiidibacillus patelloidae]OZM57883.1 cytochrome C assembly protein [Lottiidibacillus patelloidae]